MKPFIAIMAFMIAIFAFMIAIFAFMIAIFAFMIAIFAFMIAIFAFMMAIVVSKVRGLQFKPCAAYIVAGQLSMPKGHFKVTYSFRGSYVGE